MTEPLTPLSFIGIGLMGEAMTLRLLAAGRTVYVWNRSPDKLSRVVQAGAIACATCADAVKAAPVVLVCLADTAAVLSVVQQTVLAHASRGQLLIDLSSIHPATTRQMAAWVSEQCGMAWVDAPVSGGVQGANAGTLAIMAGGAAEQIDRARTVLAPLYQQLTHVGAVGTGQVAKICNQMIVSCNVLVIAEMMALAQQAGVDSQQLPTALAGGFADSKPLQIVGPQMASASFEPVKWRVQTLLKDLTMAVDLAASVGSATPMSGLAAQLMQLHGLNGYLQHDPATLINLYAKKDA